MAQQPRESGMEMQRHELLSDVAVQATAVATELGVAADVAEQVGIAIAEHLGQHWGGQLINFPKDYLFKLASRDMQIYNEFTGKNHAQLARKYKMTARGIYKIIERVHKREVDRRQHSLFT